VDRSSLAELHYLTSIHNLASICEHGVLSHDLAAKLSHVDLSSTVSVAKSSLASHICGGRW
jgi:hypothetical protein